MARRHLINVHSSIEGKKPEVEANEMKYGELAVNHFQGKAFISTRVSDTDMELFPSIHYIEQYPFSSLTVNGLTTLSGTTKIEKIETGDNTFDKVLDSNSTNAVQNKTIKKVIEDNEKIVSSSLNDLNERKLDASAYTPTDLSDYYKKEETSSKTELDTALGLKANASDLATKANTTDLTAHTGNTDIHTTTADKAKWNAAADKLNTIDTALSATSNNLVVNSAITKAIQENEEAISAALNDLNKRKLDASAYTPTDLSNYYKMTETSGKSEISTALSSKANATDLTSHTGDKTVHITTDERTSWNNAATNSHTHSNKDVLDTITTIDTALSATSNRLVTNSAITKAIQENEETISAALNDLNKRLKIIETKLGL